MEQDTNVIDSQVEAVEEQQIVEIPLNSLDRVAGGIISMFL